MPKSIENLMLEEHEKLRDMLSECLENIEHQPIISQEFFIKFKWNLEKHFFIEEKIIFSNPAVENSEHTEEIEEIFEDHKEILGIIKDIENDKTHLNKSKIEKLAEIITKHAQFEDEDFYPRLDEILTLEQKHAIILESHKILNP